MAPSLDTVTLMLDAAWRVSLVLGAAWVAARTLGRRPAALRHAVWAAALVAALAVPMLAGVVPSWPLAVLPSAAPVAAVMPAGLVAPASRPLPEPVVPRAAARAPSRAERGPAAVREPETEAHAGASLPTGDWLGLLWASVAAAILGRYLASVASVGWLTRDADPVNDLRWRDASEVAAAQLGLPRSPALLASAHVNVPFTSGVIRPVVVVPASALAAWSDQRIRVVLLHELAHVRRRDCLVQALSQVACAAYWFNPLAWVAARRLRAERERACDDLVLDAGLRGADYAQHLLDIARTATARRSLSAAALAMARPSELEGRLLAILDGPRARRTPGTRLTWRAAAAAAAVVLPVASVQPVARAALAPEPVAIAVVTPAPLASAAQPAPAPTPTAAARSTLTAAEVARAGVLVGRVAGAVIAKTGTVTESMIEAVTEGISEGVAGGLHELAARQSTTPSAADPETRQARPVSPAVIQGLTEAMKDPDPDVRKQAMEALSRLGAPIAYDTLAAALKDEDEDVRQQAAFLIGKARDPRSVPLLVGMLTDAEPDVRQQAAFGLAQMKAKEAVPGLIAAMKDEDEDVRQMAIFGLMQIGEQGAAPAYVEALKDPSEDVRQQAIFALTQLGDRSVVAAFARLLAEDKSEDVRQQAAFGLSQLGDESVVPALTAALKDPSPDVRRQAVFALSQIAGGDEERTVRRRPRAAPVVAPTPAPTPAPAPAPRSPAQPAPPPPR